MNEGKQMFGFYSAQAHERQRNSSWIDPGPTQGRRPASSYYATPKGGRVLVTAVFADEDAASYLWPDKICVGPVTTWVGDGP